MQRKGVDISTWQGDNVDFNKLKADDVEFVIIRAGFGKEVSQKDKRFELNYSKAKAANMPIGAYWYSYATSVDAAKQEAEACLQVIKGKQFEYPIYFDIEDSSISKLGRFTITKIIKTFCEAVESAGYWVGVYSNPNWLRNYINYEDITCYTLWMSHYTSNPTDEFDYDIWQYTSTGSVSGIAGNADMNWCYRDLPTEIKAKGLNGFEKTSTDTSSESYKKVTNDLVEAVIRGDYGNGDTRKKKLEAAGYNYEAVQEAVNKKLSGGTTTKKSVTDAIVNAVIRGDYGTGSARRQKLEAAGYDYDEVQAAVNKKLSQQSSSKKITDDLINAVIRGEYGNGATRKKNLEAAGYDYEAVQKAVNKKLS